MVSISICDKSGAAIKRIRLCQQAECAEELGQSTTERHSRETESELASGLVRMCPRPTCQVELTVRATAGQRLMIGKPGDVRFRLDANSEGDEPDGLWFVDQG